jgi:hypothetical protein
VAKRLLHDDARAVRAAGNLEVRNDRAEERGRDSQVVQGVGGLADLAPQRMKGFDVLVRTFDVAQPIRERRRCRRVLEPGRSEAGTCPLAQAVEVARPGNTNDRDLESVEDEAGKGGKDLLEGQVAGGTEEDEGVGTGLL